MRLRQIGIFEGKNGNEAAPKTGTVRLLRLTEKQYNNIYMVTGGMDYQELMVGTQCHIMI